MTPATSRHASGFSPEQKLIIGILSFLQFSVILDFMLMAPLGAVIMPVLAIGPSQFGLVVSAYAFAASISGVLTAGFADRFDRKKLLMFFYVGFLLGTLWCGLAQSFEMLLLARIFTGIFGGVIGSVVLAISTDLFAPEFRGRVMGFIQTAFSVSQVLGIPIGLFLSSRWNWHVPFLAMAALGTFGAAAIILRMRPIVDHLKIARERGPWTHLIHTVRTPPHLTAFAALALVATGGFMLMPFMSAYVVNNLGIRLSSLPTIYLVTGLCTIFIGPLVGHAADAFGKFRVFVVGNALSIAMVLIYTHLRPLSLAALIAINAVLYVGIFSRMIPFRALLAAVPPSTQRGAFNSISVAIQQLSGGIASIIAGHIVTTGAHGKLNHFDIIGYVVVATSLAALAFLWRLQRSLLDPVAPPPPSPQVVFLPVETSPP